MSKKLRLTLAMGDYEIVRALKEHGGNRTKTAETLGISRQALTVKLGRYGLVRPR